MTYESVLAKFDSDYAKINTKGIPEAEYSCQIMGTRVFENMKKDGRMTLAIDFYIKSYGFEFTIFRDLEAKERLFYLKKDLERLGLDLPGLSKLEEKLPSLHGKMVNVRASKNGDYMNYTINGLITETPGMDSEFTDPTIFDGVEKEGIPF